MIDFRTRFFLRSFRTWNWTICVKSEMRWTEFYEGQNWLETKIGRENNARVDLNHPFASNGSGFLIFPQKSREEGWGKKERKLDSKEFQTRPCRLCYSLFPEKWRARKRTGLSLWRGKILFLNTRRVSTRENTISSISQQVVISGGGGLKKARTYQMVKRRGKKN